jgi:signal transduction histidine kinase/ActR/RegA family two-component response regulator
LQAQEQQLRASNQQLEAHERRLSEVNRQLEISMERAHQLAQEAVAADLAKSQFLTNMSHEIRTPMNAIIGFSEVLAREELADEQKQHVDIIRKSAEHLLELINDILDLSKIEAGQLDTEIVDCSLKQVLAVVESLMRPIAKEKGLEFKILQGDKLPSRVRTDSVRLRQCLVNLIGNAIKFTETGHVYVNTSQQQVDDAACVRFDVEDTGIGIPADKQNLIFENFMQADAGATRRYGGTGLGLSITRQLAHLLGGELALNSDPGKGSVFSLTIPANINGESRPSLDVCEPKEGSIHVVDAPEPAEHSTFTGRVLVAEDSPTNQTLIRLLLEKAGLEVTVAQDGKEAVDKALGEPFDLILMDMRMPNMNGYEATQILRSKGIQTAIVAVTAHAMNGDDEKCLAAGCNDYIPKPVDRRLLLKVIRKYISTENETLREKAHMVNS